MKTVIYLVFVLTQLSFIIGSPFIEHNKCWIWDSPCLIATARAVIPTLTAGIPQLGTERLDPMYIYDLHINQNGIISDWNNIYVQGLRNTIFDQISVDRNSKVIRQVFHTDLLVKAHYKLDGTLYSLPVSGEGELTMQMNNVQVEFIIPYEIIKDVRGRDVINLTGYQYWYNVKDGLNMYFENLYYGNYELSQKMHILLHQNWKRFITEYGRVFFDKVNDKFFNTIRTYLRSQPLDAFVRY